MIVATLAGDCAKFVRAAFKLFLRLAINPPG